MVLQYKQDLFIYLFIKGTKRCALVPLKDSVIDDNLIIYHLGVYIQIKMANAC